MVGCGKNRGEADDGDPKKHAAAPASTEAIYPRLTRTWLDSNGWETLNSVAPVGSPKSLKFIDEAFEKLEWAKPELIPKLAVELSEGESLEIRLLPSSTVDEPAYAALWTRPGSEFGGATTSIVEQSPRLSGAEQAIGLLRSYVTENGDAASLVEWKD